MVLACALATTAYAAPLKSATLRVGSTGQTVMTVQQKLLDLGLSDSAVDGKYGKKTAAAVAKFQLSKGLTADGLVGEKTLAMILASKAPSTTQPSIDSSSVKTTTDITASRTTKPIIDVPVVIPDVPLSDEVAWRILCRDGKPHIQVLSPNGGEVYQAGQQVLFKWKTCNVSTTSTVNIGIVNISNTGADFAPTRNDGQELINIGTGWISGLLYKAKITVSTTSDNSDNLFTINVPQPKVQVGTSTTNPPASTVLASQTQGTNNVRLLGFTVKAIDGDVILSKVPVQLSTTGHQPINIISALRLVDVGGSTLQTADTVGYHIDSGVISNVSGCAAFNCGYTFANFGNITIPSGTTKEFSIVADLRAMNASGGGYAVGNTIKASVANSDVILQGNLGAMNQNGDNITANSTYRIGSALGNVITIGAVQVDMCPNISGIQTTIPTGMIKDSAGNCVTASAWDVLCRDGQPHVQVLSPNGGEVYQFEQQIPVTWKSCNTGSNIVMIGLTSTNNTSVNGELATVSNSGSATVTVPRSGGSGNVLLASGNFYKIFVALSGSNTLRDYSDNLFTINQPGIINPKTTTLNTY